MDYRKHYQNINKGNKTDKELEEENDRRWKELHERVSKDPAYKDQNKNK